MKTDRRVYISFFVAMITFGIEKLAEYYHYKYVGYAFSAISMLACILTFVYSPFFNRDAFIDRSRPEALKGPLVGRNQLCPCGSGKKYKRCCIYKTG